MCKYDETVWVLITRKLSGEATMEEKKQLREWLAEDPKHVEFYGDIVSSWKNDGESAVDTAFLFDYKSGLEKLKGKLLEEKSVSGKKGIGKTGSSRIHSWKLAASIVFLMVASSVFLTVWFWEDPALVSYTTSDMEQRIVTLPDGSLVRLNRGSKLEVAKNYSDGARDVRLEGEAYFDVAENPDRPFVIHVGAGIVKVLGTAFNVKEGRDIIVAVQEGTVSFRHENPDEMRVVRLSAGQLGLLSEDALKIEEIDVENYISWINGYLRFNNMPFEEVLRQLERIYDIGYSLEDSSIRSLQLTVYTERMQLSEVLETIAIALDLTYEKRGGTINWSKKRTG